MNRRAYSAATTALAAAGAAGPAGPESAQSAPPFKQSYAPGFRHFVNSSGKDPIDQIKFMHDHGFRGIEDNGMAQKGPVLQQKIGDPLTALDMTMGVFVTGFGMNAFLMTSKVSNA